MLLRKLAGKVRRRWRKWRKPPFYSDPRFPSYWMQQALAGTSVQVVQIGSNDGKTGDPLYPLLLKNKKWSALLVEPIPYLFERLKANYPKEERFQFAQAAVNEGKVLPFYYVDPKVKEAHPELPYWHDQLGSFDREHLVRHLDGKLKPYLLEIKVAGLTLPELFTQHSIDRVDILHIDVEGYDWKVLAQLDLQRYRPSFILFEHHHLADTEKEAAQAKLATDYHLYEVGIDWLAVQRELPASLLSRMKGQLSPVNLTA